MREAARPPMVSAREQNRPRHRRSWLLLILAVGMALRLYRLSWGLPDFIPPDSLSYYIRPAARLVAVGEVVPPAFLHTPLFVYAIGSVDFAWSHWVGEPIDLSPRPLSKGLASMLPPGKGAGLLGSQEFSDQLSTLIYLARAFCAVTSILAVAVFYLLANRLVGARAALLGSAAFALSPLFVLEAHRVNADGLMILFAMLASHRSVAARQDGSQRGLLAGFAFASLAGAVRYNGMAIVSLPSWIALRWPGSDAKGRLRLLLAGGLVVGLVLAIGLLPAIVHWEKFQQALTSLFSAGFVSGGNLDLSGEGWVYHRYVYQLVVSLPYALGWPVYLCGWIGLFLLARSNSTALGVIAVATVPFLLVQGAAVAVEHRYYQLIVPFLALSAGAALDYAIEQRARLGALVACAVLAYTAALTGSQCLRLGLGPQREVAAFVGERSRAANAAGGTVGIGYPGSVDLLFDPVRTQIQDPTVRVHHIPHLSDPWPPDEKREVLSDEALAMRLRDWFVEKDVNLVVWPSWQEGIAERSADSRNISRVYNLLTDGRLGFHEAADYRTGFLTEPLYVWADPLLDTYRVIGILGYRVFVPDDEV